ncbi:hypothetical protein WKG92_19815 [Pantoea agglomerans]|uniref:hypothetical protein n=1 Tax=Enterobacter agglomerans TaxID=549 RepID=UPI003C7C10F1
MKLARRVAKTVLFIALFCIFARLIDASTFISLDAANNFAAWLHGEATQENHDDLWFFTDVLLSLLATVVAYNVVIRLCRKVPGRQGQH